MLQNGVSILADFVGKIAPCRLLRINSNMAGDRLTITLVFVTYLCQTYADVYLHNMRGSNNRLNEPSANRKNANRVFDSQNNNRGGYNVGDKTDKAFTDENGQYQMQYFQSDDKGGNTNLVIEWTNQHGCGGNEDTDPHKLNCNLVLQYMCQSEKVSGDDKIRDGTNTNTNDFTARSPKDIEGESKADNDKRKGGDVKSDRVVQEPWQWYDKCRNRVRNQGLFTADQKLRGEESIYTRQNPNGNRRGYECPEERDYYPYWHPTPFVDIAVMADSDARCKYFQQHNFNSEEKYECMQKYPGSNDYRHNSRHNNKADCEANGGEWLPFMSHIEIYESATNEAACKAANDKFTHAKLEWGRPIHSYDKKCLVRPPAVECHQNGYWSRVNHLGNGRDGVPLRYTWRLPFFPSQETKRCVFRLRYNVTTDDYDPFNTNSSHNEDKNKGIVSPVEENPEVDIGLRNIPLRLAINTAQYGRTFQDRSHVYRLLPRPTELLGKVIHNLNVRGKRGNIVQTYPAVEYDFIPTRMTIKETELVHIQWTGSNTHNNGNPAGDGQAGDDGEGQGGTDRNNIVEMPTSDINYGVPMENSKLAQNAKVVYSLDANIKANAFTYEDIYVSLASAGYFSCYKCSSNSLANKDALQEQLNNAPASYPGLVMQFKKGQYYYMCTRNNNFTNRSQKGQLKVE